ncbi:C80 family cysteine peptidase [Yersinia aleksiciae]|uniref:C80 family cysteine peptidase n=1 Tax=Yersinia aleksiciae TaxID=263819 RepID=UPI0025AADB4D|nr:C80 family cysteine peptidase [Yersinia aleksiciae]MDN0123630.1 C80 family cysteine peptidase [Yersinia aleksiciae]
MNENESTTIALETDESIINFKGDIVSKEINKTNHAHSDADKSISPQEYLTDFNGMSHEEIDSINNDNGSGMKYDYQVVFQLSDDKIVREGSKKITRKHYDKTIFIQYNIKNKDFLVDYGFLNNPRSGNVRWILTGHGGSEVDGTNTTLAGYNPKEMVIVLQEIREKLNLTEPKHVVLAGCNLANDHRLRSFGFDFSKELWRKGINASVKAYNKSIAVDIMGRKDTVDSLGNKYRSEKSHRVNYRKDHHGTILVNDVAATFLLVTDIVIGSISVEDAIKQYPYLLVKDFSQQGQISHKLLLEVVYNYDVYLKFNDFFSKKTVGDISVGQSFSNWLIRCDSRESVLNLAEEPINLLPRNAVVVLDALAEQQVSITQLGETTRRMLGEYLTHSDDHLINREILRTVSEPDSYLNMHSDLLALQQPGTNNPDLMAVPATEILNLSRKRFQSIGQKVGAGTQTVGLLTLSISTATMARRLLALNITDEERAEITRQLAISWSATVVDFGTDLMQPTFDKLHNYFSKKLLSGPHSRVGHTGYNMATKSAKYAGSTLNLASAGFDIYEAIDHFTKAEQENNPDLRTDYIVNGGLSTVGAAISIATAVALAMGMSAAGPIGIAVGAAIMLGSMIYNAVRQVEYIKREIDLNGWEEFKTGIRLAFGSEPENNIKQRLEEKNKEKLREYMTQRVNATFEQRLKPMGYNRYTYVEEPVDLTLVTKYVFVYKVDLPYITWDEKYFSSHNSGKYLADNILDLSYSRDFDKGNIDRYELMRYARRPLSGNDLNRWKQTVNIDDYEVLALENIDLSHRDEQSNALILNDDVFNNHDQIGIMRDIWLEKSEQTQAITAKSDDDENFSTHFNPGGGSDLVIGYKDYRNSFDLYQGEKLFIGGEKEDIFYLMGDVEASVHRPASFLDGQGGSDTIFAMGVRFSPNGYEINLAKGYIKYRSDKLRLANVINIENIFGQADSSDILIGNDNVNYLNGGGGATYDHLEGLGGNDILTLQKGVAMGGDGIDTYIISPHSDTLIDVEIIDSGVDEVSIILLPVNAEGIRSILLRGNDAIISVGDEVHSYGQVVLKDAYKLNDVGDERSLSHTYIINTSDSLILLPDWPQVLDNNINEFLLPLEMIAYYNPMITGGGKSFEQQKVTIIKGGDGHDSITVNGDIKILPTFIKASLNGSQLTKDIIFGDGVIHNFESLGPGDAVTANGGDNTFNIPRLSNLSKNEDNTLKIDCRNLINYNRKDNTVHFILGDVTGYDLCVTENSLGDLIISHRDNPDAFLNIDLTCPDSLKYNGKKKPITFVDKNNTAFFIENRDGEYGINQEVAVVIESSNISDNIIIPEGYRLVNNHIALLGGDDVICDLSRRGNSIIGGLGHDIIYAKSGNNTLMGNEGDDELFSGDGNDYLSGGKGQDKLAGGNGFDHLDGGEDDDIYVIEQGYGKTTIRDEHGKNTVILRDVDYRELWFGKQDNKLLIAIKDFNKEVVIEDYFSEQGASVHFSFQTNDHKIEGENLCLLIDLMMQTPDTLCDGIQDPTSRIYAAEFNRVWDIIAA